MNLKKKLPGKVAKSLQKYPLFYQKVWKACCQIPPGEVRTYGWIAKKIGRPKAMRAVGNALARNPFAPLIPCHRVILSDGSLGGYSGHGGVARKRQLLTKEKQLQIC